MNAVFNGLPQLENLVLVIRINHFTGKIDDGYLKLRTAPTRISEFMTPQDVGEYIHANPTVSIDPLKV